MSANRARAAKSEDSSSAEPQIAQVQPTMFAQTDHSFTLQTVMELQKTVGELNSNINNLIKTVDGVKTKVDDLVGWKNKILGGVAVLGLVVAGLGYLAGKASDYVTLKTPTANAAGLQAPQAPAAEPAAATKKAR